MILSQEEAFIKVRAYINFYWSSKDNDNDLVIVLAEDEHSDVGYFYYYNGSKYINGEGDQYAYIGNVPVFIDKRNGYIFALNPRIGLLSEQVEKHCDEKCYIDP